MASIICVEAQERSSEALGEYMNRSIGRLYFHVGFIFSSMLSIAVLFLCLKTGQLFIELSNPVTGTTPTFEEAMRRAVPRRLDDPSLWALGAVVLSGLWILRAANKCAALDPLARFAPFRSVRGWLEWFLCASLSATVYLTVVYKKHETFWFMRKPLEPAREKYAGSYLPDIQLAEGIANLAAIAIATSLAPPAFYLVRRFRSLIPHHGVGTSRYRTLQKFGAALASIGAMPVTLIIFMALYLGVFRGLTGWSWTAAATDAAFGMAGALFICWPMLLITFKMWMYSTEVDIKAVTLKTLMVPLWLVEAARGRARPPCWVVQPACLKPGIGRQAYDVINAVAWLGGFVCLWYDPRCSSSVQKPPPKQNS